ncbi:MAG: response regulator [Verrucomicrobiales bacterium]|nr:response regulator [Verrucomicrobiales bacterium]
MCLTNSMHILLAEDDENDALLMQRAFRKTGEQITITVLRNGQDVIDYLQGSHIYTDRVRFPLPDLILLDLKMPQRNGFEVLEFVKTDVLLKRIPTVLLSSSRQHRDIVKAYDLRANSYLVKPTAFTDLLKLTQNIYSYWFATNLLPDGGLATA